jgi:hypothetical protein
MDIIETKQLNKSRIPNKWDNIIQYMFLLSMSWLIFYSPFVRGMYFESEQRPAIIYTLFVFILFWTYKWIKGEPTRFFRNKLDIALFALVAMYGLSFFWAVSKHDAIFEWLKYCMYFSVYYIISDIADTDKKKYIILWIILLAGLGLSIIGLDGMLGSKLGDFLNQYLKLSNSEQGIFFGTFVDNRINSTLQYPNVLAIYLAVSFIGAIQLEIICKKNFIKHILLTIKLIILITIVFTQSRGGIAVFLFGIILIFLAYKRHNKLEYTIRLVLLLSISFILFIKLNSSSGGSTNNLKQNMIWIIGSLVCVNILYYTVFNILKIGKFKNSKVLNFTSNIVLKYIMYVIIGLVLILVLILKINLKDKQLVFLDGNNNKMFTRTVNADSDTQYNLIIKTMEVNTKNEERYLKVEIYSKDKNQLLIGGRTELYNNEINIKNMLDNNIYIKTFKETKQLDIILTLKNGTTKLKIESIELINLQNNKKEKDLLAVNESLLEEKFSRFKNAFISKSFGSRRVFYKDAIEIIKRRPIFGGGGNSWEYTYQQFQSYEYWTSQTHNYMLQLIVEVGIVGVLIFIFIVFLVYKNRANNICKYTLKKEKFSYKGNNIIERITIISITIIIIHSFIDFDLSLSSMMLLLFCLLAISGCNEGFFVINSIMVNKLNKSIILVILLLVITIPIKQLFAFKYTMVVKQNLENNNLVKAIESIKKATKLDKYKPHYYVDYANLLLLKSDIDNDTIRIAQDLMESAKDLAKDNVEILINILKFHFKVGNIDEGLKIIKEIQIKRPHWEYSWEITFKWYMDILYYYRNLGDKVNIEKIFKSTEESIENAEKLMEKSIDPIIFNPSTCEALEKILYLKHNINEEDIKDVVFYSNYYDINNDNYPDQWVNRENDLMKYTNNEFYFETKYLYITTREIFLKANKKYNLKIYSSQKNSYKIQISEGIVEKQIIEYNGICAEIVFKTGELNNLEKYYLHLFKNTSNTISFDKIELIEMK